jgi:hypothetical protein
MTPGSEKSQLPPRALELGGFVWQGCVLASHPNALNHGCRVIGDQGCSVRLGGVRSIAINDTPAPGGITPCA